MMTSLTRWVLAHKRLVTLRSPDGVQTPSSRCAPEALKTWRKGFHFAFELGSIRPS
jgi:hypothetical protein